MKTQLLGENIWIGITVIIHHSILKMNRDHIVQYDLYLLNASSGDRTPILLRDVLCVHMYHNNRITPYLGSQCCWCCDDSFTSNEKSSTTELESVKPSSLKSFPWTVWKETHVNRWKKMIIHLNTSQIPLSVSNSCSIILILDMILYITQMQTVRN